MRRGRKAKAPFSDVPSEFKESVESASDEQINAKIADIAKNDAALADAKKQDEDLKNLREQVTEASRIYREGHKANKEKIAYARMLLEARGKDAGSSGLE